MVLDMSHCNIIKANQGLERSLQRHGLYVGCGYQEEFDLALELESLFGRQVLHMLILCLPKSMFGTKSLAQRRSLSQR